MAAYNPLLTAGQQYGSFGTQSAQMIADANGTNGPEGIARAQAAFRASPGYQYQVGQATDAATRAANTAGGALGGNTLSAVTGLAGNLADQDYSNWIKQLQTQAALYSPLQAQAFGAYGTGAGNAALTGGTGAANIYTGAGKSLADLYSTTGQAGSNLYQNTGKTLADIATGGAGAKASVYQTGGQNIAALLAQLSGQQVGFDQSTVAPTARSYEDAAAAQIGGSQNLWNLGVNAAKLGAGLPSGTFGGTYSNVNATPGTGYDASKFGYGGLYTG
jgi:hypothetical protein